MSDAASLMDRMYRWQRHIYDASRKFYLLGRDGLIADLAPPPGAHILEVGCGTGRNLIAIARAYPTARCYGLDVSAEMLATAENAVARAGLSERIVLRQADATAFNPHVLFGRDGFDRIVISYALSMIPPWRAVLDQATHHLAARGSLHIVDFGDGSDLPAWFRAALTGWLGWFHVEPRVQLPARLHEVATARNLVLSHATPFRGYAVYAVLRRP
ncbi:class I SAM-dependent methyltransferase [Lichenihabitans psoromatis]|uniref:class I SAM-dependent methyltransferase n=1 Tax=Lichenihabitans psoromatis TaxID=2528642 RepID=UPI00315D0EE5